MIGPIQFIADQYHFTWNDEFLDASCEVEIMFEMNDFLPKFESEKE